MQRQFFRLDSFSRGRVKCLCGKTRCRDQPFPFPWAGAHQDHVVTTECFPCNATRTAGGGQSAKVRNASIMGNQTSILELIASSLDSIGGLERFAWRLCLFSSTPTWTRTANGFVRPAGIPKRIGSRPLLLRINFRMADQLDMIAPPRSAARLPSIDFAEVL